MPTHLYEIICKTIKELFGSRHFNDDNKILFSSDNKELKLERCLTYDRTVTEIEINISKVIDPNDDIYRNGIVQNLAEYFANDNFLFKFDVSWESTTSKLIGELIVKLFEQFNDIKRNMAYLSGCLISVFRQLIKLSSYSPSKINSNFILFIDCIRKYAKHNDKKFWRSWLIPRLFLDWCLILACVFLKDLNIIANFKDKLIFPNAMLYFKKIKYCKYVFINKKIITSKSVSEILQLSESNSLLDAKHLLSPEKMLSIYDINVATNESKTNKPKLGYQYVEMSNECKKCKIEEVCPVSPRRTISICFEFSMSNSFKRFSFSPAVINTKSNLGFEI